jgi:DnaD/phage-associated family protein
LKGWISLHRKIQDHWLFKEKRQFSKFEAWIDILLMVNHEDSKVVLGNELIEVKRGQRIISIRQLCNRWGWSNTKVTQYLNLLQNEGMLVVKSDTKKTLLTVEKYEDYQESSDKKTTENRHGEDTKQTRKHTNNNVNNANKENKKDNYNNSDPLHSDSVQFFTNNFGQYAPFIIDNIVQWENEMSSELVVAAMKIALQRNAKTFGYAESILKEWKIEKIQTLDQARVYETNKWDKPKNQHKQQKKNTHVSHEPDWIKKQTHSNVENKKEYSTEDLEFFNELLGENHYKVKE